MLPSLVSPSCYEVPGTPTLNPRLHPPAEQCATPLSLSTSADLGHRPLFTSRRGSSKAVSGSPSLSLSLLYFSSILGTWRKLPNHKIGKQGPFLHLKLEVLHHMFAVLVCQLIVKRLVLFYLEFSPRYG
ncbi:hypothetical protein IEQ34_000320 [Dendrobium chrysotoxum]|uniref:Uncharacterized protein n=1 Tax=Dendrobium chrysotoxum TaxID=161865 RepID=A0AAV7HSF4_DENCH|nr:hypothetical protein IEQ34_000320 [Dendrobium chrysotoxum]